MQNTHDSTTIGLDLAKDMFNCTELNRDLRWLFKRSCSVVGKMTFVLKHPSIGVEYQGKEEKLSIGRKFLILGLIFWNYIQHNSNCHCIYF